MKVIFVHGALIFHGAWWWHRMVEPLAAFGLGTRAVELPSCVAPPLPPMADMGDMHSDADGVRAALDEEDEPVRAALVPAAFMQDCDEEAVAGALKRLARQPLAVFGQSPRGVAREAFDVCGVRRGPCDPAQGTERIRNKGGSRGGDADRPSPDALATRVVGQSDRRGGGRTGCLKPECPTESGFRHKA